MLDVLGVLDVLSTLCGVFPVGVFLLGLVLTPAISWQLPLCREGNVSGE